MIITSNQLLDQLKDYGNPYGKIGRMVKEQKLFPITKGLYETNKNVSGLYLAGSIYGPSYISFNTALAYYGMIPEAVYSITSATTQKLKKKSYQNIFGTFTYQDVPTDCFYLGVDIIEQNGYYFKIATKEKALCDKLYEIKPIRSVKEIKKLLFEDMRLEIDIFDNLNREEIYFIAPRYHSTNLNVLVRFLKGEYHE